MGGEKDKCEGVGKIEAITQYSIACQHLNGEL